MRYIFWMGLFLAILLSQLVFSSCSTVREVVRTEYRDSLVVQKERYDSLIFVPIPLEKDQAIVHVGDTSKLETSLAESTAFIGDNGHLHHSLRNRNEKTLPVLVPVTSQIIYHGVTNTSAQTLVKTEWKEKPLSWWQSLKIGSFWYLCVALLACLLYIFRKPLLKLIKLWI